ncbi:MAG: fibronectin type III domain-containing protein [Actinobacteria bacterium]|nr:fibronectin type III domain-containing protein [Actinomycetota bacterium]
MRPGRMFLSVLAVSVLTLVLATSALAYYTAKGSGTFTALLGTLHVPTISSATAATGGMVALSWASAEGPGEVSYSVTRNGGAPGGTCPSAAEPETEVTSCTDEGLEPGTYVYKVTAKYRSWTAISATKSATVTVGPADHFVLTAASSTPSAGAADNLTITAKDKAGGTVTTYAGEKSLTFSGAEAIGTNKPTVVNVSGTAVAFGTATTIKFTSGVATVASSKNGVMKLYKAGAATISVSDGTIESEVDPTVTVAPLAMSKLVLSAATATPAVAAEDALTTTATDTYGNVATAYTGSHSLVYSGPVAAPNGTVPTVSDKSGNDVAIGTATPTNFTNGVATVSEGNNGALVLYKAAAANVKVTEGSTSSATVSITAAPGTAASLKVTAASTTPVAGATDNLTTTALDAYGNTATSYAGNKNITFSGPEASPNKTAASVTNLSGTAVAMGSATALTFTSGVATVSSTTNGVFKAAKTGANTLSATDGSISTASALSLTVSAGTAVNFAWSAPTISAGTLGSPCLFTCTVTTLGNSGTFIAKLAVTDALGNVVSNVGASRTATVTATGGTITGGTLTIASTGLAESTATFTYKAPASGSFTNTITATKTGSSTYANATATVSK